MEKIWKLRHFSPSAAALAREADIPLLLARLLTNRGIADAGSVLSFLTPRLSHMMDPMLLKDMDAAVNLIMRTLEAREQITIFGDYDVDGITATSLLYHFFSRLGIPASFYIPDRLKEGYGLNPKAVEAIAGKGPGLIITVDCGTGNGKEIEMARRLGLHVLVTDHHQVREDFNPVCPVINPQRQDSPLPFKDLTGVGMAFLLAIALRAALREKGWFGRSPEPDLRHYLDLVALGTIADMAPLTGQNRILVHAGIEAMKNTRWTGIKALLKVAELDASEIASDDLAFRLAPRLNAPGRLGDSETGIQVLMATDPQRAMDLARRLNTLNGRRQALEQNILRQIEETIACGQRFLDRRTFLLAENGWHRGVLGIVASRILDRYHRPTLILSIQDGMASGSGRSIEGFNLHGALSSLGHLFERFGGHCRAAGFTLKASNVEALASGLEGIARETLSEEDMIPVIDIDGEMMLSDITPEIVGLGKSLSPFGSANPEPRYYARSVEVIESGVVGGKHLKLKVRQDGSILDAIGFGLSDHHPLAGKKMQMVFTPEINRWRGCEKIQLRIIDLEIMEGAKTRIEWA